MKTAMQIAVESYKNDGVSFTDWFLDNYEMLLEKEKEQIIEAYNQNITGFDKLEQEEIGLNWAEDYYNQTYNQKK
jgi:hypothetical protein